MEPPPLNICCSVLPLQLHVSWPLEIPTLQFSHTCSIHFAGRQVSIRARRSGGGGGWVLGSIASPHAPQCTLQWLLASQGKKIHCQTEIQAKLSLTLRHCLFFFSFFLRGLKPADARQSLFCVCKPGLDIKRAEAARLNAGDAIIRLNLEYTSRQSVW